MSTHGLSYLVLQKTARALYSLCLNVFVAEVMVIWLLVAVGALQYYEMHLSECVPVHRDV